MAYGTHLTAFVKLGQFFTDFCENDNAQKSSWSIKLEDCLVEAEKQNAWFTKDNLQFALRQWGQLLSAKHLGNWLNGYTEVKPDTPKTVAIIMAGNIPFVGFHDFICVLLSGHKVLAKLSSNDRVLLPIIADFLCEMDPTMNSKIEFTQERLEDFDAVIATGSNNTSRYFDYYFGKYPNIIRKNRTSIAILNGKESDEQLQLLGNDIFIYFGLGCRSVSKLFVPEGYDFDRFFKAIFNWKSVLQHHKYINNYDYNKAVYLMSNANLLDNEFLLLKEDSGYGSPIGALFYEYYRSPGELHQKVEDDKDKIQCAVASDFMEGEIPFGQTQSPGLQDYADGVDTLKFLSQL